MYINEAAKLAGTTKKAIEYYCQKGLLDPAIAENLEQRKKRLNTIVRKDCLILQ